MNEYAVWAGPIIALGALIYTVVASRSKKHEAEFAAIRGSIATVESQVATARFDIDQRVDRLEDRTTRIESEMGHLPDKDVTQRLELAIERLNGEVRTLGEQVKPISRMADRMQEAILDKVANG